jgi:hypothetical protein
MVVVMGVGAGDDDYRSTRRATIMTIGSRAQRWPLFEAANVR